MEKRKRRGRSNGKRIIVEKILKREWIIAIVAGETLSLKNGKPKIAFEP
jgi:hypothetical protein